MNEKKQSLEFAINNLCDAGASIESAHEDVCGALSHLDMPSLRLYRSELEAIKSALKKIENLLDRTIDDLAVEAKRDE